MSDEQPGNPSDPTHQPPPPGYQQPPPNWGNAYPPPPPGYGYPYPQYAPKPPQHPRATTAMVLGIIGLTGFACYVTFLVAPVAWILGARAVKEIDANPQAYSGRSEANAGKIMGIVGTVLLILALLALTAFIVAAVTIDGFWDDDPYDDSYYSDFVLGWLR
ncbi:DUF4190 domain-containing protein [Aeromicrobium ginsengisoli]|uniref:DUF4190 domain-containing protein n=1 Tax=Aeromicrobium ginsengisoli TaxID=363867 RepID=A0A5M4FDK8_9ACTN|nr:DUF4190 domain-containing protein [Aeromicrobium ginsengisoli]KAA1397280.1 DUF4190 domain-containing protein [Aeromicrobium ginsengisoli]